MRFRDISVFMPESELVGVIRPGTRAIERDLHRRFHKHRVKGEWFHLEPLNEIVRSLRFGEPVQW